MNNIIATIKRSCGNETVGEMWQETKIFEDGESLKHVFDWARERTPNHDIRQIQIIITVGQ